MRLERDSGTSYNRNDTQISEAGSWTRFRDRLQQKWRPNQWGGVVNDDFDDFDADRLLFQLTIYNHRHRWIHTETMRLERESGTNYNRNDSENSEMESGMMLQILSTLWHTETLIQKYSVAATTGSIQRELAMNEKQGPTTTEMTSKTVKWSQQ